MHLKKKVIIFGTGNLAKNLSKRISNPIAYYIDNDSKKWGSYFLGIKINNPNALESEDKDKVIIIVASSFFTEIAAQLMKLGFKEYVHFWNGVDLVINPLNKSVKMAIEEEANKINEKCLRLIERNMYQDALALLDEYEKMVPLDNRIQFLKSLIEIKQGRSSQAEQSILKGLSLSNISIKTYKRLFEIEKLKSEKKYLEALECYEEILIDSCDSTEKKYIIESIS